MNQRFNHHDNSSSSNSGPLGRFQTRASSFRLALISASWHADIVGQSRQACLAELQAHGLPPDQIECFEVPGAFEIPLHAKTLIASGRFDAVIAFGLIVDGGIYRHDFVATAVIDGLMRVQLDTGVPVFSAVLTPHHFHEHEEHRRYFSEHFVKKGREAAQACMQTLGARLALAALQA